MRNIAFGLMAVVLLLVAFVAWGLPRSGQQPTVAVPSSQAPPSGGVHVPTADEAFLAALAGKVTTVRAEVAEEMGRRVCSAYAEGLTSDDLRTVLIGKGLTAVEANRIILAAAATYCPEFQTKAMG